MPVNTLLRIKEIRTKKKITIAKLAIMSGISQRMISRYEAGASDITLSKLQNIASTLRVDIWELVESPSNKIIQAKEKEPYKQASKDLQIEILKKQLKEAQEIIKTLQGEKIERLEEKVEGFYREFKMVASALLEGLDEIEANEAERKLKENNINLNPGSSAMGV